MRHEILISPPISYIRNSLTSEAEFRVVVVVVTLFIVVAVSPYYKKKSKMRGEPHTFWRCSFIASSLTATWIFTSSLQFTSEFMGRVSRPSSADVIWVHISDQYRCKMGLWVNRLAPDSRLNMWGLRPDVGNMVMCLGESGECCNRDLL